MSVCLSNMTDLVQARFQSFMPLDDRILLVDNRAVPFAGNEGTRGNKYLHTAVAKSCRTHVMFYVNWSYLVRNAVIAQ